MQTRTKKEETKTRGHEKANKYLKWGNNSNRTTKEQHRQIRAPFRGLAPTPTGYPIIFFKEVANTENEKHNQKSREKNPTDKKQ